MEQRLQKAIEQKEQTVSLEYRVVRPDGRTVWLMVNGSLSEQRGNTLLTGMVIDISHQSLWRSGCAVRAGISARSVWKIMVPLVRALVF